MMIYATDIVNNYNRYKRPPFSCIPAKRHQAIT